MTKRDWTLLTIAAANGEALTPVQLQKALFLLGRMKLQDDDFYNFIPYNYGPYDAAIYREAERLEGEGLIAIRTKGRWKDYSATPVGLELATRMKEGADADTVRYLQRAVEWVRSLSFQTLIRSIYARFPEYRVNSVFQY